MSHSKLAAQLYTVREFTQTLVDFKSTLEKVREIGYTAVQVSGIGPLAHEDVKAALDEAGLTVCITHISFDDLQKDIAGIIAQHHLWQCPNVAVGSLPGRYREEGEAGFHRFAQDATAIGKQLADAGLTFSYHNHSFELARFGPPSSSGAKTGLDIIYDESDPRYLKAEIDTYWIQHGGGDVVAWIRRMKDRMPVVHFKDMAVQLVQGDFHGQQVMAEVGAGNLNWPGILAACEEAGVEWYAVEQDVCQRSPFESLKISYENLRTMGVA
ncbi:MAG: sugar phosphate isomerase/epimerase [Anaerolineae bacterium]|nr:sugar phosphate isomerase/epimerase [Anaerolineae bacterium]